MVKFVYNNSKNEITGYIIFNLNCDCYLCISYKKDMNSCFLFKITDKV